MTSMASIQPLPLSDRRPLTGGGPAAPGTRRRGSSWPICDI